MGLKKWTVDAGAHAVAFKIPPMVSARTGSDPTALAVTTSDASLPASFAQSSERAQMTSAFPSPAASSARRGNSTCRRRIRSNQSAACRCRHLLQCGSQLRLK